MRLLLVLLTTCLALPGFAQQNSQTWSSYPGSLPVFNYEGKLLKQSWPLLAAGTRLPWPDEAYMAQMISEYPALHEYTQQLVDNGQSHPALIAALNKDYTLLAAQVQQVWRFHFEGQYQQAYELGMKLGPAGYLPALYSKLIHTTFLITTSDEKELQFKQVEELANTLKPLADDYPFLDFGNAYQKARRLELMSTSAAASSGLLSDTMDRLKVLYKQDPDSPLYPAMLGGIHAGVIERVGGFVGSMTYGVSESEAIEMFENALAKESRLPVLYNEFAQALIRIDGNEHQEKIRTLLEQCTLLTPYSAEEALNQDKCIQLISAL